MTQKRELLPKQEEPNSFIAHYVKIQQPAMARMLARRAEIHAAALLAEERGEPYDLQAAHAEVWRAYQAEVREALAAWANSARDNL